MNKTTQILIVEDSATQALKLQHTLKQDQYESRTVANGEAALRLLETYQPDLVISDIVMPHMDGYELCRRIKSDKRLQQLPVILLTSLSDPLDVIKGLECGANNFITKPYKVEFLRAQIRHILINRELRQSNSSSMGLEIFFGGKKYTITSNRVQILDLLFSSFENAVDKKRELEATVRQLKRTEQELLLAKEKAEKANLAKSAFLANMSHEIRTPLNGVLGMSQLLFKSNLSPIQQEYVQTISDSSAGLLGIINDILDFSKTEAGKIELETIDFSLFDTLEHGLEMLALKAQERNLDLEYILDPEVPTALRGDPGRLHQILLNLLGNAVKFTEHGTITEHVQVLSQDSTQATLKFAIRDTGIGIPPERQNRLFKSFSQVDASTARKYGGTGLGLAICKRLVKALGGRIGLESTPGHGTTFWFTAIFAKQPVPAEDSAEQAPFENRRILSVGTSDLVQRALACHLSRWKCQLQTSQSLAQARKIIENNPFDLVIVDQNPDNPEWLAFSQAIQETPSHERPRLSLLTDINRHQEVDKLKTGEIVYCLRKPLKHRHLFRCLSKIPEIDQPMDNKAPFLRPQENIPNQAKQQFRILLVEDNIVNRKVALGILKHLGFRADIATSGQEALQALGVTNYDLIFMDIQMPGMDGFETTRAIRHPDSAVLDHDVPIVAMTGYSSNDDQHRCLNAGMNDYVSKPISFQSLERILQRFCTAPPSRNQYSATGATSALDLISHE
jgi:signal transduction histidine kinase/BarA-like signal transduction histidine kinase